MRFKAICTPDTFIYLYFHTPTTFRSDWVNNRWAELFFVKGIIWHQMRIKAKFIPMVYEISLFEVRNVIICPLKFTRLKVMGQLTIQQHLWYLDWVFLCILQHIDRFTNEIRVNNQLKIVFKMKKILGFHIFVELINWWKLT